MSDQLLETPSKHSTSLSGLADAAWNRLSEGLFNVGWSPLARLCEAAVVAFLKNISAGHLRVLTYTHIYDFPPITQAEYDNLDDRVELRVVNDAFWVRLLALGDLGFSESYMAGDVECDDLVALFRIFLQNRDRLSNFDSKLSYVFSIPQKLTSYRFLNTIGNSRSNISAHYDLSNDMFAGFLSEDMTYSCAIFKDLDSDLPFHAGNKEWSGAQGLTRLPQTASIVPSVSHARDDELHEAQMRKLNHVLAKAKIRAGDRVLEIGSGWGSMAILIAQTIPDTTVDTLTLSVQQQSLAQQRIAKAGLQDRITVHLMDYRNMPVHWESSFDRVISIEMMEAVGAEFLSTYWNKVDWALKDKNAVGVVQVITIPEARFDRYVKEIDFIRKYSMFSLARWPKPDFFATVFPGGCTPTVTMLLESLREGSSGRLVVDSIGNIGPHYARTLREWRRKFLDRFDAVIAPALKAEHPELLNRLNAKDEVEIFKRKWLYYFCYCEIGFATRTLGDHIITFTREGCEEYECNIYA